MSRQKLDLALAFLVSQPAAAAAVLELVSASEAARFLREAPPGSAAVVLQKMLPSYVASLCAHLEPAVAAELLKDMDTDFLVAVLRCLDRRQRRRVLERLPERVRVTCRLLLHYSEEAVGAWMVASIRVLPEDCSAAEAQTRLTSELEGPDSEGVYVVDRDRKLRGFVGFGTLLSAASDASVSSIMEADVESVSGRASLVSVADHPVWAHRDSVAVVNRKQQLVGMLRHVDLRKGLGASAKTIEKSRGAGSISGAVEIYGQSFLALFGTVCEAVSQSGGRGNR